MSAPATAPAPPQTSAARPLLPAGRLKALSTRARLLGRVARSIAAGSIYKVNYDVTTHCNSRCLSCNVWKYYDEHPEDLGKELDLEEIEKVFSLLPPSVAWLSMTGGEPFLREDSERILHAAIDRIPGLRLISVPTNALAKERTLRMIRGILSRPHPLFIVSVSLDGPPEVHDRVRGVPGGFERSWDTYLALRELAREDRNFVTCIESTVSSLNATEVGPFLEGLVKDGHDLTITIGHQGALYNNVAEGGLAPTAHREEVARIVERIRELKPTRTPKDLIDKMYLSRIPGFLADTAKRVVPCASLQASATINHFGDVLPCLMWDHPLGNVREHGYSLGRVLEAAKAREARAMIVSEKCPNCWTPCEAYQSLIARAAGRS